MSKKNVKSQVEPASYEMMRKILRTSFPDKNYDLPDSAVDSAISEIWLNWRDDFQKLGLKKGVPPKPKSPSTVGREETNLKYYMGYARHTRRTPKESEFVGNVPCVRLNLPLEPSRAPIETAVGWFYQQDHLIGNLLSLNEYLKRRGIKVRKAEMITPVRFGGARFAAVAVGIAYVDADDIPDFYWLEAGMATGESMVLYFSDRMNEEIVRRSGYDPTPFSSARNWYIGHFGFENGEPTELKISSKEKLDSDPYIDVKVRYVKQNRPELVYPGKLLLEAAVRVSAIARSQGREVPDLGPLTNVVASLGDYLTWSIKP